MDDFFEAFSKLNLNMSGQSTSQNTGTPSTQSSQSSIRQRSVPDSLNLNEARKLMPKLSKDNAHEWLDQFQSIAIYKDIWWIITTPEQADLRANYAADILLRSLIPESDHDLLNQSRGQASTQYNSLKSRWLDLQPDSVGKKLQAFYRGSLQHGDIYL